MDSSITVAKRELELYSHLHRARSIGDFRNRIRRQINVLGFSDYSYTRLKNQGETCGDFGTLSSAFAESYYREGLQRHDVMLQYSMDNTRPAFLSFIHEYLFSAPFTSEAIQRNRDIQKMARSFNYLEFYNMPLAAHDGQGKVLFSISSRGVERLDLQRRVNGARAALSQLAKAVDAVGTRRFPDFLPGADDSRASLINPRPLLLLTMIARENLTIAEAAARMGISLHTANKQMAAAKQALGASTQASAVYLAIKEGLIEV